MMLVLLADQEPRRQLLPQRALAGGLDERLLRRRPLCGRHPRGLLPPGRPGRRCSWKRSAAMYRSVVPSLRGTGRSVSSPSVLPGNSAREREAALTGIGREAVDVDESDDLAGVRGDVRDHGAAVGVGDEHDRPVDGADEVADGGGVGGQTSQRVGGGDHRVAGVGSGSMTLFQLADSANAPWTRTMVGFMRSPWFGRVQPVTDAAEPVLEAGRGDAALSPGVREWSSSSVPK